MLQVPGRDSADCRFAVSLPREPGRYEIVCRAQCGGLSASATVPVVTEASYPVIADLLDPQLPYTRGHCIRGGQETEGLAALNDGSFEPTVGVSGGVARPCLFSHPPYGGARAGYSFAAWDITLPAERTSLLQFQTGMRDGLDATDGVTFRVVVITPQGTAAEVFSRHYRKTEWEPAEADLTAFAGKKVRLKLIADCGPKDDTTADHALWAEPKVVLKDEREMATMVRQAPRG